MTFNASTSLPNSSAVNKPVVMMSLQDNPDIQSEPPASQATVSDTGILHVLLLDVPTITHQYWTTTRATLPEFTQDRLLLEYDVFYFTPFYYEVGWLQLHPGLPITNTIYPRLPEIAPSKILSFSLVYKYLTPSTQEDNSPSNTPVDPTTALITLMAQ